MQDFNEYLLTKFNELALLSKEDILKRIERERNRIKNKISDETEKEYYESLDRLFGILYEYVDESELFDAPGDWWHYTIFYDCYGIKLCLQKEELDDGYVYYDGFEEHYDVYRDISFNTQLVDQYTMISVNAKMLSAEEYARKYGVVLDTVRKWVRRGKIRCAVKNGRDWRIPELAQAPNIERGYRKASYRWHNTLMDVPEGFDFINEYNRVEISQLNSDKKLYDITFHSIGRKQDYSILRSASEKEKLEIFLIANSDVSYDAPGYGIFTV